MTGWIMKRSGISKIIVCIMVFFLSVSFNLFAWQNTFKASDEEYENLMLLKTVAGVNLPDVTTPVSGSQMLELLSYINPSELNGYARELYDGLYEKLSHPQVLFKEKRAGGDLRISVLPLEVIGSIGDDDSDVGHYRNALSRYDLYDVDASLFITDNFFGKIRANGSKIEGSEKTFASGDFIYNTVFIPEKLSQAWPDVAFGSVGNDKLNMIVGRDRLSAGNGVTGNMYLSENRKYDDFMKFSAVAYPISYDFTAMVYDGFTSDSFSSSSDFRNYKLRTTDFSGFRKMVFIHRFSSTILKKITVSAYEGAVFYGDGVLSDLRALNPFMFIHNNGTYYTGNTNNFAGLEIGACVAKGINANVQVIVDQFKLSSEKEGSGETQIGLLANLKGAWGTKKGIVSSYIEGIYSTEGLYLKEISNKDYGYNYNGDIFYFAQTDMVTGNKRFSDEKDEYAYLGYPQGGDLTKIAIGLSYKLKDCSFSLDGAFTAKGCYGINKAFNEVRVQTDKAITGYDSTQYCYCASASAEATFLKGIECCATLSGFCFRNYLHEKGVDKNFIQLSLGCKIDPTLIFIKRNQL